MIRLIASDMDGTLLRKDGTIHQGMVPLIRKLREEGIYFVIASGRPADVYKRQIEDILSSWEEKKKETEAAIAEAAKRDEERKKEREHLRATGQLPDLNIEVKQTVPEEIQRLIEEIEGRLPVKIHVEPIERQAGGSTAAAPQEPRKAEPAAAPKVEKEPGEIDVYKRQDPSTGRVGRFRCSLATIIRRRASPPGRRSLSGR